MHPERNKACPCGSGKKYKNCCAIKKEVREKILSKHLGKILVFLLIAGMMSLVYAINSSEEENLTAGKVWSAEHGHWHNAASKPGSEQPPGPVPDGMIWSVEHGHWHDAKTNAAPVTGQAILVPKPPGPTPEGKVWSPEHGHWHDAY